MVSLDSVLQRFDPNYKSSLIEGGQSARGIRLTVGRRIFHTIAIIAICEYLHTLAPAR